MKRIEKNRLPPFNCDVTLPFLCDSVCYVTLCCLCVSLFYYIPDISMQLLFSLKNKLSKNAFFPSRPITKLNFWNNLNRISVALNLLTLRFSLCCCWENLSYTLKKMSTAWIYLARGWMYCYSEKFNI